jgi:hypothetical protein
MWHPGFPVVELLDPRNLLRRQQFRNMVFPARAHPAKLKSRGSPIPIGRRVAEGDRPKRIGIVPNRNSWHFPGP